MGKRYMRNKALQTKNIKEHIVTLIFPIEKLPKLGFKQIILFFITWPKEFVGKTLLFKILEVKY